MDEIYEVRFFIFNKGWSDRTLTGIELEADSNFKETLEVLRVHEKDHPLSKGESYQAEVNVPTSYLIELKKKNYPIELPKQSYTEIVFDKASSLRIAKSNKPITLFFDRDKITVTK